MNDPAFLLALSGRKKATNSMIASFCGLRWISLGYLLVGGTGIEPVTSTV